MNYFKDAFINCILSCQRLGVYCWLTLLNTLGEFTFFVCSSFFEFKTVGQFKVSFLDFDSDEGLHNWTDQMEFIYDELHKVSANMNNRLSHELKLNKIRKVIFVAGKPRASIEVIRTLMFFLPVSDLRPDVCVRKVLYDIIWIERHRKLYYLSRKSWSLCEREADKYARAMTGSDRNGKKLSPDLPS